MKSLLVGSLLLCGGFLPQVVAAKPAVYECWIGESDGGWLPGTIKIWHEPGSRTAKVDDRITERFLNGATKARVVVDNGKKLTVAWSILVVSASNQRAQMDYGLTIERATMDASMRATPARYENSFRAKGGCTQK